MIQFTQPLYLILLIPLAYYTYRLSINSLADLSRPRFSLVLRAVILGMLVFALAGARMVRTVSRQCVVFVLDVSDSIPKSNQDAALAYINKSLSTMKRDQMASLVVFGGDASVEMAPSNLSKVDRIYSIPKTSQTDISQALGLALALFPEQCARKIVLFSDGNETLGKSVEQAMLAGSEDVSIDVVPTSNEIPHESLLDRLICPSYAKVGEPFDLKVVAVSKEATIAQIRILRNGVPAGAKTVQLTKGNTVVTFQQSITKPGNYEFKALIDCNSDTIAQNNVALGYTMVKGKPRVLYVEGEKGQEKYLSAALKSSDIDVETRDRSGIPNTLAQLRAYDMVILSDVPAWNLAPEQMEMIKSGVKDLGIGFTMIGGENSFGAGGYFDTPIEEALPVDMSIRKTKVLPSLSVIVVIDKSGSMSMQEGGVEKIRLANDAAAAVVKLLQPIDKVGVIVCHDFPVAAVNLQQATNKDHIYSEISTIRAEGGGITVFPSIQMANEMISGGGTRQKHIILIADGRDCDSQEGVIPLVKQMASKRITVSTVAIGDGEHVPFLKATALTGKGEFYLTQRASDLKAILTKDVMAVSKSLVIEEPFVPLMDPSSTELSGIDMQSVPPLLGYVATSPKHAAGVSMMSHRKDPILATWQYGLGKSAAFTPDCKARWSSRWLAWGDYNRFWAQVLRSTMRKSASSNFQTTVDIEGGTGRVAVDAVDEQGNFLNLLKFKGSVVSPDMQAHPIAIDQTGPGHYEATFDAGDIGNYLVNVIREDQTNAAPEANVISIPYPPEYKDISPNTAVLQQIASETHGIFSPKAAEVFTSNFRKSRTYTDLWRLLVLLATIILPVDIAVRRLNMDREQVMEVYLRMAAYAERIRSKLRRSKVPDPGMETISTLLQSKKEREPSIPSEPTQPQTVIENLQPKKVENDRPAPPRSQPVSKPEKQDSAEVDTTSRLLQAKKRAQNRNDSTGEH